MEKSKNKNKKNKKNNKQKTTTNKQKTKNLQRKKEKQENVFFIFEITFQRVISSCWEGKLRVSRTPSETETT